jgi:enoyl-CoA hydratase/carnithine racemase
MAYKDILVTQEDAIGVITLNRPDQRNMFSSGLAQELNQALIELENDRAVRVVIIKGSGEAFCVGVDINEFPGKTVQEYREWVQLMGRMVQVIAYMKKPVIASAHGYAVANGAGLIAACDLAVVSDDIQIGATAINVGLFCMGPAVPLSRAIGRKRCLELLMTGEMIDAPKAEAWGLVNRVVPRDRLEQETMAMAKGLADKSPLALQMGKEAFYGMSDLEYSKALAYTSEMFVTLSGTEDAQEGVEAFLGERKPLWKGR